MTHEVRRQAWYALVLVLLPLTMFVLDRRFEGFASLPLPLHWAAGIGLGLLILTALRLTNPWETPNKDAPSSSDSE